MCWHRRFWLGPCQSVLSNSAVWVCGTAELLWWAPAFHPPHNTQTPRAHGRAQTAKQSERAERLHNWVLLQQSLSGPRLAPLGLWSVSVPSVLCTWRAWGPPARPAIGRSVATVHVQRSAPWGKSKSRVTWSAQLLGFCHIIDPTKQAQGCRTVWWL